MLGQLKKLYSIIIIIVLIILRIYFLMMHIFTNGFYLCYTTYLQNPGSSLTGIDLRLTAHR